jgi:WD40 repeat protein
MFGSTTKKLNPNDGSVEAPNPPEDTVNQIVWSPNNEFFACPSWDKKARVWYSTSLLFLTSEANGAEWTYLCHW